MKMIWRHWGLRIAVLAALGLLFVFGQQRVIFVSQRFHIARAIYLARAFGIEAWGLNAKDVPVALSVKTFLREKLACVKAVLDVNVLGTRPKFLGEKVVVPLE